MITGDGSKTIHMPDLNEQYHSKHGALQEARHVFIKTGLEYLIMDQKDLSEVRVLEYGFGTGLNAILTAMFPWQTPIHYIGLEAYPIEEDEIEAMDYGNLLQQEAVYHKIHSAPWEKATCITDYFTLTKKKLDFENVAFKETFDIIYFDAFGPRTQPELWTLDIFKAAFDALTSKGVLVTYCAAGQVRRNMQAAGFRVERLPGPPGKREMLRATKD